MSDEQSAIVPIEFKSSIVAVDLGTIVIGLFDGEPATCVAILKCEPEAARGLSKRIGSALETS